MRLTPTERDRLLIFTAAELARARRSRGHQLNVPEATAIIADAVCEAARDGKRITEAAEIGRTVLRADEVMTGVAEVLTEVKVEALFDDGTRMVVVRSPFPASGSPVGAITTIDQTTSGDTSDRVPASVEVEVLNTGDVPVTITSHFHFFEVNRRLRFDRSAAYGMRLAIPAGASLRFPSGEASIAPLVPIGGNRIAIGFSGLVDGPLDAVGAKQAALERARALGFMGA